jgi:Na+/H+-dicarboxylate symporter
MNEPPTAALALPEIRVPALWTFAALAAGIAVGALLEGNGQVVAIADAVGGLWLRGLQMTIVPLVAALLVVGIVQTVAAARAGEMARRTLLSFAAILLAGAVLAVLATPALLAVFPIPGEAAGALRAGLAPSEPVPVPGIADFAASLVPQNIVAAAADGAMLPLIVFFALFGVAVTRLPPAPRQTMAGVFAALAGALLIMIGWVLKLAPLGVFALALAVAAKSGAAAVGVLAHYIAVVSLVGLGVMLGAYLVAVVGARIGLGAYSRAMIPAQAVAISTQSSLASLPAMLGSCRELRVRQSTADFVLPLAVALFRATGPAMNLAVVIYVATMFDVPLTPAVLAAGIGAAMLTTLGAVSLPGSVSFVTSIAPIAVAMGVPLGPLALLIAVEVLPDIMRTLGNVSMDVAVTALVDRRTRDAEADVSPAGR